VPRALFGCAQDPLNLASSFDIKWMREAELKHGRLSMLAVVGFIATDLGIVAPGAPVGFSSVAAHDMAVEKGAMYVLLFAASLIEVTAGVPAVEQMMKGSDRKPGEFAFGAAHGRETSAMRARGAAGHARRARVSSGIAHRSARRHRGACVHACAPDAQTRSTSPRTRPPPRSSRSTR